MVKILIEVSLLLGVLVAGVSCQIETRNFTQWLDHFDENCTETWNNTYYIDESFYEPGGPIFLYVGDMQFYYTWYRLNSSHFIDIAREVGALIIGTEHRYYGESRPTADLTTDNLIYLSTAQALEDVAELIRFIRSSSPDLENAKVIASGVGHGGALATWLRQRYPDLVHAAWSSSAKLNALLNFGEFHTNTAQTIRIYGGQICYDRMANAFALLDEVFEAEDWDKLIEVFKLCGIEEDVSAEMIAGFFFETMATAIGQYISMMHAPGITTFCGYLERGQNDMYGLADWVYYAIFNSHGCLPASVSDLLYIYMDPDWFAPGSICNFILNYTMTADDLRYSIDNTNAQFGGLHPNVTRVYFTNGNLDSEKTLSILTDLNEETPADVIPYFGYGADYESMNRTTYEGVRNIQERARSLILEWLETEDVTEGPTESTEGTTTSPIGEIPTTTTDTGPVTTSEPVMTPYY
ncbi:thymus-specific serine protease [Sergentomyia squamirostris]